MTFPSAKSKALFAIPLACVIAFTGIGPASADDGQAELSLPGSTSELSEEKSEDAVVYSADQSSVKILDSESPTAESVEPQAAGRYIDCKLGVHIVHGSHHVKGTINGTASVKCKYLKGGKAKVSALGLSYSLIRVSPKNKQWAAGMKNNSNKSLISNNRAVSCSAGAGRFQGWAQAVMRPPKGYKLATAPTKAKYGKSDWVACGKKGNPKSATNDVSEEITVTFAPAE